MQGAVSVALPSRIICRRAACYSQGASYTRAAYASYSRAPSYATIYASYSRAAYAPYSLAASYTCLQSRCVLQSRWVLQVSAELRPAGVAVLQELPFYSSCCPAGPSRQDARACIMCCLGTHASWLGMHARVYAALACMTCMCSASKAAHASRQHTLNGSTRVACNHLAQTAVTAHTPTLDCWHRCAWHETRLLPSLRLHPSMWHQVGPISGRAQDALQSGWGRCWHPPGNGLMEAWMQGCMHAFCRQAHAMNPACKGTHDIAVTRQCRAGAGCGA